MELKIFIDRLKDGHIEKFSGELSTDFLQIKEEELTFTAPITLKGEAYLAIDHLILRLHIETKLSMPCSICNHPTELKVNVPDFYHAAPLSEIRSSIFDYTEALREDILLQVPQFIECNNNKCPERENIKVYLKTEKEPGQTPKASHVHFPFSDL